MCLVPVRGSQRWLGLGLAGTVEVSGGFKRRRRASEIDESILQACGCMQVEVEVGGVIGAGVHAIDPTCAARAVLGVVLGGEDKADDDKRCVSCAGAGGCGRRVCDGCLVAIGAAALACLQ